jgi:hypothetical protein
MKKLILIVCCLSSFCKAETVQESVLRQMPMSIREKIFKDAEKKHPNDFVMMEYEAEKQVEAYVKYVTVKAVLLSKENNPFNNNEVKNE